jgi:DNA-binding protein
MEKSVITDTNIIIEKINDKILESNKKYYNNVLEFLNMLFNEESKSILKVKLKQISLSEDVLEIYNYIIKKHGLKKNMIDVKYFDFDIDYDTNDVIKMVVVLCNNLFEKINYPHKKNPLRLTNQEEGI